MDEYTRILDLILSFFAIGSIIVLIDYIIGSVAYYKALKLYGYKYAFAAWVPFWDEYALADCFSEKDYEEVNFIEGLTHDTFKWYAILKIPIGMIPIIGQICAFIVMTIGCGITYMVIIKTLNDEPGYSSTRKILGYVASVLPIIFYIQMFMIDGKKARQVMERRRELENSSAAALEQE